LQLPVTPCLTSGENSCLLSVLLLWILPLALGVSRGGFFLKKGFLKKGESEKTLYSSRNQGRLGIEIEGIGTSREFGYAYSEEKSSIDPFLLVWKSARNHFAGKHCANLLGRQI